MVYNSKLSLDFKMNLFIKKNKIKMIVFIVIIVVVVVVTGGLY
jgi:hypothetical protein